MYLACTNSKVCSDCFNVNYDYQCDACWPEFIAAGALCTDGTTFTSDSSIDEYYSSTNWNKYTCWAGYSTWDGGSTCSSCNENACLDCDVVNGGCAECKSGYYNNAGTCQCKACPIKFYRVQSWMVFVLGMYRLYGLTHLYCLCEWVHSEQSMRRILS